MDTQHLQIALDGVLLVPELIALVEPRGGRWRVTDTGHRALVDRAY